MLHHSDARHRRERATAQKRRYRARLRAGVIIVDLEVTNDDVGFLIDLRYLDIAESEDRKAIAAAVQLLLRDARESNRVKG